MSEDSIREAIHGWDQAMITNDAEAIGMFMADEWVIVGPDGSVSGKANFLSQVASGALTHDEMTSEDIDLRRYGDTVVAIARGVSAGRFRGQPFRLTERGSNVFVWPRRPLAMRADASFLTHHDRGRPIARDCPRRTLQPRVDRLGFQRQDGEHALVDPPQRLATGDPVQ